ncbi:hypothetical protein [Cytobacillus sp. IB215665]|uniref:hypothetical protein n=1 Tax=Cytobacillus sp. IB215665 TaxID=3097357 RepID=UPI002A0E2871|nr:hypothetical protein [Cytobacillus sp. IB215665]MDX8367158.1 hypothetical protein [Cytobacillus sp. IB215665]
MKKFSRIDLLNNSVVGNTGEIFNRLFESKYVRLEIYLPTYDLKRAQVFVMTVNDLIEDEVDEIFTVEKLIVLLYKDFLRQVEMGMDIHKLAKILESKIMERNDNDVAINHYLETKEGISMDDINRQIQKRKQRKNAFSFLTLRVLKKFVLKGEVLLHDLNELHPSIHLSVEELIAIRFKDVMSKIKAGDYTILSNIVSSLTAD